MATLGQIASAEEIKAASVIFNLAVMLGFGLGPLAIALARSRLGWPGVFGGALGLFAIASLTLLAVRTQASDRRHEPVAVEIRQGLAAVRANPLLLQLMVAAMAGYLAMGPMTVLLPKLAATRLGLSEMQRGAFLGTLALALIAGGVVALAVSRRAHHGRLVFGGTVLAGVLLGAMGTSSSPAVAVVLLAGVGIAGGLALSLIVAGIQANAPESVRGRVLSMYTIISQVVPAASGVIAGALVQGFGVGVALVVCGGTLALAMLGNAGWMGALRGHRG
jgi:predicted MFS family arabinose efflux permease